MNTLLRYQNLLKRTPKSDHQKRRLDALKDHLIKYNTGYYRGDPVINKL